MRIGLIGEAPSDTSSVYNLLSRYYYDHDYFVLLNNIHGSMLENQKTKHLLRREFEILNPDIVVFIRDLDSHKSDRSQIARRKTYFREYNNVIDRVGVFMLSIFELEALILSDINTFNIEFKTQHLVSGDPMDIINPKEVLKTMSQRYSVGMNPKLFSQLDINKLQNCQCFSEFIRAFESLVE